MTIHDFDMARFISGSEVVEVYAAVGAALVDPAIGEVGDIDTAVVMLRHDDGCLTVIDNSRQAVYGYDQRVEAFGTKGMAMSENPARHTAVIADDRAIGGAVLPRLVHRPLRDELRAAVAVVRRQRAIRSACQRSAAGRPRPARRRPGRGRVDGHRRVRCRSSASPGHPQQLD